MYGWLIIAIKFHYQIHDALSNSSYGGLPVIICASDSGLHLRSLLQYLKDIISKSVYCMKKIHINFPYY
jgi:hypothetical protein